MEEVATCKICGGQHWIIYRDRIECRCGKTYMFESPDAEWELQTRARDIIHIVNDNY